jgi:hypothetical protein
MVHECQTCPLTVHQPALQNPAGISCIGIGEGFAFRCHDLTLSFVKPSPCAPVAQTTVAILLNFQRLVGDIDEFGCQVKNPVVGFIAFREGKSLLSTVRSRRAPTRCLFWHAKHGGQS